MATYVQRWAALCESLLGAPATVAQQTRLGEAVAAAVLYMGTPKYVDMTNAQKAEFCIKHARSYFLGLVKQKDNNDALAAALAAAAAVDTEFAETP